MVERTGVVGVNRVDGDAVERYVSQSRCQESAAFWSELSSAFCR